MDAFVEKANKFLDSFTATDLDQDPLPIRHVPKGITSDEAAGYSILWVYEYLYMRSCPLGLMQNAMKAVHEEMVKCSSEEAGKGWLKDHVTPNCYLNKYLFFFLSKTFRNGAPPLDAMGGQEDGRVHPQNHRREEARGL